MLNYPSLQKYLIIITTVVNVLRIYDYLLYKRKHGNLNKNTNIIILFVIHLLNEFRKRP